MYVDLVISCGHKGIMIFEFEIQFELWSQCLKERFLQNNFVRKLKIDTNNSCKFRYVNMICINLRPLQLLTYYLSSDAEQKPSSISVHGIW